MEEPRVAMAFPIISTENSVIEEEEFYSLPSANSRQSIIKFATQICDSLAISEHERGKSANTLRPNFGLQQYEL